MPARLSLLASVTLFIVLSSSPAAVAETRTWVNPAGGNWNVAGNWDTGIPQPGDDVVISGAGAFNVNLDVAATINSLTLGDAIPDGVQSLTMTSFALTINGPAVVQPDGRLNWNGAPLGGAGTLDITAGGQFVIGGGISAKSLAGLDINNAGTVQWLAASINCTGGAIFQNLGGASFVAAGLNFNGETCVVRNAGSFTKTGTGAIAVSSTFQNDGTVEVQTGTLSLTEAGTHNGSFAVAAGAILQFGGGTNLQTLNASTVVTGAGTLRFSAGTTNVAGTVDMTGSTQFAGNATLTGPITSLGASVLVSTGVANLNAGGTLVIPTTLTLNAGTLTGSTSIIVTGATAWNGGDLGGTGKLTVNGGMTIGGSSNKTWNQKVIDNPATTIWNSTNITAAQGARFNNLAGGLLDIRGTTVGLFLNSPNVALFDNQGTVRRSIGTGSATIDVPFQGPGLVEVQSGTLTLSGSSTHDGDITVAVGSTLLFVGATHTVNTSVSGAGTLRVQDTVNIPGTINISGRTWITGGTLNVTGTMTSLGNSVELDSGTLNLAVGGTLTVPGSLILDGGTLTGTTSVTVTGLTTWNAATLSIDGKLTVSGGMTIGSASGKTWIRTVIDNPGVTNYFGWHINCGQGARFNNLPAGTFNVRGDASLILNQGGTALFVNEGIVRRFEGTGSAGFDVPFQSTGVIDVQSGTLSFRDNGTFDGDLTWAAGSTLMFESGTHTINATSSMTGAGTLRVHISTVNMAGTLNSTGRTWLSAGTFNVTGTVTSLGDPFQMDGATADLAVGGTLTVPSLILNAGILKGNTSLTVTGLTTWSSTFLQLNGKLTVSGGMNMPGGGKSWINTVIDNPAIATWTGFHITMGQGARFNNLAGGTFDIRTDAAILSSDATVLFNNQGTLKRSAGAANATFSVPFESSGKVEVNTGTLHFTQGPASFAGAVDLAAGATLMFSTGGVSYNMNAGSTLTGAGTLRVHSASTLGVAGTIDMTGRTWVSGGTLNVTGTLNSLGNDVELDGSGTLNLATGGALTIPDSLILNGGVLTGTTAVTVNGLTTWNATTLQLTGKLTVGGGLTMSGTGTRIWIRTEIDSPATTTWASANVNAGQGARFNNLTTGTFLIQTDADLLFNQGGATPQFHNAGVFRKTAGTATQTSFAAEFMNTGTAEATAGTISFTAGYTQTAGVTRLNGGTIGATLTPGLDIQGGVLTGTGTISGNVRNAGALNAGQSPGRLHITGTYTQTESGALNAEIGGLIAATEHDQVTVAGTASLAGTLNGTVVDAFDPSDGNSFTIMTYAGATGDFTTKNLEYGPNRFFSATANATNYVLTATVVEADLSLSKSGPASVAAAETITYTLAVSNAGPASAQGLVINDALDANVTFAGATTTGFWNCSHASQVVSCSATGPLASGASSDSIIIAVTAPADGSVSNSAVVTANTHDPNAANNSAGPVVTTITPVADLAITKTPSAEPIAANQSLTYTVTVHNHGPSTASQLSVSDQLDPRFSFLSAEGLDWSCGLSGLTVTCDLATLAAGTSSTIQIFVQTPNEPAIIPNTATVAAPTADPHSANNSSTATSTITAAIDLSITKADTPDPVILGTALTYTITVANAGPSTATNVVMNDVLPPQVTFFSAAVTEGSCTEGSGTVSCTIGSLGPGASATITIVATPVVTGVISNTATVSGAETDLNPGNDSATEATTVGELRADLSITMADTPDPVTAGAPLTYTMEVTNEGPDAAASITMTDVLPAGVTLVSAGGTGWNCGGTATVVCTLTTLPAGPAGPITIVVTAPTEGTITNTASVTSSTTDPDPANNSAEQSTMVLPDGADVFLIKTGNPSRLVAGAELTYQLSVGNRGPAQASGVLVTDTLPADVTLLSVTTSAGTCSGSSNIVCDIGTLARDAIATVEVRVRTHSPGTLTNTASVVAAEDDADLSNNTDTESTIVDPPGDLSITKSGPSTVTAGGVANYVIEVINGGNVAIDGAGVRDVFPPQLAHKRWTCAATPGSSCGRTSGSGSIHLKVDLAPGGVATFAVETKVVPGAQGSITNTATVEVPAGVSDPNLANNTASTTAVVTGQ